MTWESFDDKCDGCLPVLLDLRTGKPLPAEHEAMKAIMKVWDETTLAERQAFHRVTCLNSRADEDLLVIARITERFQREIPIDEV